MIRPDHLDQLTAERARQEAKFPNQHLPSGPVARQLRPIMHTHDVKFIVDARASAGQLTWSDVLAEEVVEAFDEATAGVDLVALRAELIQVAAVCLRWLEDLDRG